jgi:hypothetical protein
MGPLLTAVMGFLPGIVVRALALFQFSTTLGEALDDAPDVLDWLRFRFCYVDVTRPNIHRSCG